MSDLALLGPQYRMPNLRDCLATLGVRGPLAVITAGWQEREGEIDELAAHVATPVVDLSLYARTEQVYADDPALAAAARERQLLLQELQEHYRLRLDALMTAVEGLQSMPGDTAALRQARRAALGDVRRLDRQHLAATSREHAAFARAWQPQRRPSLARQLLEIGAALGHASALLIAGGHVAVLLNRLRLFGVGELLAGKPLVAWSAGAMAVAERVVLFHDHPPQGAAHAEILEAGLGLVQGVVPLPHAGARLALADVARVRNFARRFAPATCLALDHGSCVCWQRGRIAAEHDARRLTRAGRLTHGAA